MNTYEYRCNKCKLDFELTQHFSDRKSTACPKCNTVEDIEWLMSIPAIVKVDVKTLGMLAEKNTRNQGHYARQEKEIIYQENRQKAKDKAFEESRRLRGMNPIDKSKLKTPFYKKNSKLTAEKAAKMTDKQKQKYIDTGEI